jgi:hypothetical protein
MNQKISKISSTNYRAKNRTLVPLTKNNKYKIIIVIIILLFKIFKRF